MYSPRVYAQVLHGVHCNDMLEQSRCHCKSSVGAIYMYIIHVDQTPQLLLCIWPYKTQWSHRLFVLHTAEKQLYRVAHSVLGTNMI